MPSYGSSSSRPGYPGVPSHDLLLDDHLDGIEWDTPAADDDQMPWQAGALVGAGDVEIFGRPPRWRRIGPRGVAAVLGTVMLAGLAGLQVTGNLPGGGDSGATPSTTTPAAPTTAVPVTPSSAAPTTTAAPTTALPTTAPPTTAVPTTAAPTTVRPSTAAPLTAAPASVRPPAVQPPTTLPTAATQPTAAAPSTVTPPSAPASSSTVTPQAAAPLLPAAGPVTGQSGNDNQTAPAQAAANADNTAAAPPAAETAAPPADEMAATGNTDAATPAADGAAPATDNTNTGNTNTDSTGTAGTNAGTPTADTSTGAIDPSSSQPIHATANTNVGAATTNNSSSPANVFEPLRNNQAKFSQFANVPSNQLDFNALTTPTDRPDNGGQDIEGQFRTLCEYSHINYDDPIVFPGQPGRSHLHMFFGNTNTDAFTTTESLVNSGGGTCDGFELNRSAYWFPAMIKGDESVIAPYSIVVYYKTKNPANAVALPQGLKLVAGNPRAETFEVTPQLSWSCGGSGNSYNETNHIPTNCGTDFVNATIQFPNCWDGVNLDSADHMSHVAFALDDLGSCPASHPKPIPQISILLYWQGTGSVDGWHLSSDNYNGFNAAPGSTLHADWFGGWNEQAMNTWMTSCIKAVRNCSGGQTGTDRVLAPINGLQIFEGNPVLPLPAGSYQMG